MITLQELKEWLSTNLDECSIIDLLEIEATELVNAFEDKIQDKRDYIEREITILREEEDYED